MSLAYIFHVGFLAHVALVLELLPVGAGCYRDDLLPWLLAATTAATVVATARGVGLPGRSPSFEGDGAGEAVPDHFFEKRCVITCFAFPAVLRCRWLCCADG